MSGIARQESGSTVGSSDGGRARGKSGGRNRTDSQSSVQFADGRKTSARRNSRDGRKQIRASASKGAKPQAGASAIPRIIVDRIDITPKPLSKTVHPLSTGATPLDEHLSKQFSMPSAVASPRATTPMSDAGSDAIWGDQTADRKARQNSVSASGRTTPASASDVGEERGMGGIIEEGSPEDTIAEEPSSKDAGAPVPKPSPRARLTQAELDRPVTITLKETETFWLLDVPGYCVALDSKEAEKVQEQNKEYEELKKLKAGSDSYVDGVAQTLPSFPKNKEVQCAPPTTSEMGVMASTHDIYDAFHAPADGAAEPERPKAVGVSMGTQTAAPEPELELDEEEQADLSGLAGLPDTMKTMERMLSQNVFHGKHLNYRNYRAAETETPAAAPEHSIEGIPDKPGLEKLWTFSCSHTEGRNVSALAWNKKDQDLCAASYGAFDFSVEQKDGVVVLWSLKNPKWPERIYHVACGVTSVDWSEAHPFLMAVGLYDGNIAIYDTRSEDDKPMLQSGSNGSNTEKHHDPVWQVGWVNKGLERGECLVSISTDGRVKEWKFNKGLEVTELFTLKESAPADDGDAEGQNFISHFGSGLCFDFSTLDPSVYLAGTESGQIHKCSCSYNEMSLQDFNGHEPKMPVYKLRWSPFAPNTFLSCSADWTVKLWKDENTGSTAPAKPLLSFTSSHDYVADIRWAPNYSTVFGSVTGDGKLDIWDIEREILKPLISFPTGHTRLSALLFAEHSPVVITGSDSGAIDVYRIKHLDGGTLTKLQQAQNLHQAIQKNLE